MGELFSGCVLRDRARGTPRPLLISVSVVPGLLDPPTDRRVGVGS